MNTFTPITFVSLLFSSKHINQYCSGITLFENYHNEECIWENEVCNAAMVVVSTNEILKKF